MTDLRLDYFHAEPLPNRYAASIQILCTGAAFAERGNRFTCQAGTLSHPASEILAEYGLRADPRLALAPFFRPAAGPRTLQWLAERRRFAKLLRGDAAPERILMTRGETGFRLLPLLRRLARQDPAGRPRIVYEMHRLAHLRAVEKRLGRRASEADLHTLDARHLHNAEKEMLHLADAVVFLTPAVAAAATEAFGPTAPSLILPSGVDLPRPVESGPPEFDLVYAGKIEARKGVFDLCAAMAHLPGRRLAIAGGPESAVAALRSECARHGVGDRIECVGWLPPAQIDAFLRRGRIGVCPLRAGVDAVSDRFTSPMKLLQMMALGLPVVATDLPPVRAVARHGETAMLAPANDPEGLAATIARLLDDPGCARRIAAAGRARAADFAWPARAARLEAFLSTPEPPRTL